MYFVQNLPFLDFSKEKDFFLFVRFFYPPAQHAEIRPLFGGSFWFCLKSFFLFKATRHSLSLALCALAI